MLILGIGKYTETANSAQVRMKNTQVLRTKDKRIHFIDKKELVREEDRVDALLKKVKKEKKSIFYFQNTFLTLLEKQNNDILSAHCVRKNVLKFKFRPQTARMYIKNEESPRKQLI